MTEEIKEEILEPNQDIQEDKILIDKKYITKLRDEAKTNRVQAKENEKLLREALGLTEDESISDWKEKISSVKKSNEDKINETMSKTKELLLGAAIKNLDGYDTKLVAKLLDRSTLEINDAGDIIGLTEAVEKLSEEFPTIKKVIMPNMSTNPASNQPNELQVLQEQLNQARQAGNTTMVVSLKNKIFNMNK